MDRWSDNVRSHDTVLLSFLRYQRLTQDQRHREAFDILHRQANWGAVGLTSASGKLLATVGHDASMPSKGRRLPNKKCCMMGNFDRTSAQYILIMPEFTCSQSQP